MFFRASGKKLRRPSVGSFTFFTQISLGIRCSSFSLLLYFSTSLSARLSVLLCRTRTNNAIKLALLAGSLFERAFYFTWQCPMAAVTTLFATDDAIARERESSCKWRLLCNWQSSL